MVSDWLWSLPEWLVVGLALGAAFTLVAIGVFFAGVRLFPASNEYATDRSSGDTGEAKRRAEIREYLQLIDEPYAENQVVEGQRVAFYLPQRGVAVTFDAQAYFRLDGSSTRAVLIEHEMPGLHLGDRLPFETPELEPTVESADPVAAAFDTLDLPRDATPDDVKAAYRDRVKDVHPDHGGDEEAFQRVREAYALAREHST
ncbi:J domain-containing protein [Halostella salina]|uniref:J domain-containing protein n=1 Tax=Halostella salina TaxID=1547897 RepID=UPI000EF79301|nr:J domain-containing protein [Halostella salina]